MRWGSALNLEHLFQERFVPMKPDSLLKLPLFEGLDLTHLATLAMSAVEERFACDQVIFEQGKPADRLYILLDGRVSIRYKPYDGDILSVTEVKPNGVFGWSAALGRPSYTSCAVSVEESHAVSVRGDALKSICEEHPKTGVLILERLAEVIAERLQNTHAHVIEMLREGVGS
jgi:CRP-like cAMP-binding protein